MKGIVETVAGVIERLSISSTEKKRLKQELETLLVDYEREHLQVQSGVLRSEAQGNWLQRSCRCWPIPPGSGICWKSDWADISSVVSG